MLKQAAREDKKAKVQEPLPFSADDIALSRARLEEARHLPAFFYTSPEILELEKRKLFLRDWLVVGREEQFANAGDFRTMNIAGEPIVICRDGEGRLNAFVNSCRHRGVQVAKGSGNTRVFTCPFHAWTYDQSGRLITVLRPRQMEHFDSSNCRMPPLKVDTHAGFVFVNFDERSPLDEYLDVDGFRDAIAFLRCQDLLLVDTHSYEIECNWKLVPENLADPYHAEIIHRETFGRASTGYKPDVKSAGLTLTKYGYKKFYSSGTMAPDGELLFGPMPWLREHPAGKHLGFSFFLRPNFSFFARSDLVQPWVCYPLSPSRTQVIGWTLLPREFADQPAFKEKVKVLAEFCRKFSAEDEDLMTAIQKGFSSRFYPQGPLHELERMIHHRVNRYLDAVSGDGDVR